MQAALPPVRQEAILAVSPMMGLDQSKADISMQQAFGLIRGSDGTTLSGSGNFTVTKAGSGIYDIKLQGTFSQLPVVVASPGSNFYMTSNVLFTREDYSSNWDTFRIETGFTDQSKRMDGDFTFIALWP